jgi:sialate O-acetylesterase
MHSKLSPHLVLACGLAALVAPAARADVKLHPLFTDHAVLQRGMPVPVWGTADPGEDVSVALEMRRDGQTTARTSAVKATADSDGRWMVKLPEQQAGGPYELTVRGKNTITLKDILVGEVWVCSGQSNMEWPLRASYAADKAIAAATNPMLRLFTVPKATAGEPQKAVKAEWKECTPDTVPGFTAVGYFFGRDLQKALNVPVGLIHTSWGGTPAQAWTSKEALNAEPSLKYYHEQLAQALKNYRPAVAQAQYEVAVAENQLAQAKHKLAVAKARADGQPEPKAPTVRPPQRPQSPDKSQNSPSTLYNAMIAPLLPYAVKGAIWYQGESNAGKAYEYRTLFAAMIRDWRQHWGHDLPFLCVQLAPFTKIVPEPTDSNWAELREAQLLATKTLPKVGMAVITDVGEENDIHPKKKEPVGARLALLARKIAYGEAIVAMGPVYKSMKVEGNRAVLSFDKVGAGLECRGDKLAGFTIAGADQKFHTAEAEIRGDTVVVHSPAVEKPVAVRFGWANYPVVNLWNKDGLPATPFRTDDWPGVTQPRETKAARK